MRNFINKILKEAESFSDDFFQSKHVNKRKEEFEKELSKRKIETLSKIIKGLKGVRIAYDNNNWSDDKEKLFLELFSKLHVDDKFFHNKYEYGYFLLDSSNFRKCSYDLKNNVFWISYSSIWRVFETRFDMSFHDIQSLMNDLLKEHFKLYDITAVWSLEFNA